MEKRNKKFARSALVFLLVFVLTACTTQRRIEGGNLQDLSKISVGDKVEVITEDPQRYKFVVTEITENSIKGEKVTILFENIDVVYFEEETESDLDPVIIGAAIGGAYMIIAGAIVMLALLVSFGA